MGGGEKAGAPQECVAIGIGGRIRGKDAGGGRRSACRHGGRTGSSLLADPKGEP